MKHILLVEDNLGDAKLAQMMLAEDPDFETQITCAGRLSDAAKILSHESIDLILLDLSLPDAQGLDGVRKLLPLAKEAPIVVLSGTNNKRMALDALKCGAQDYIIKGMVDGQAMIRVVQYAIERKTAESRYRSLVGNIPGVVYRCTTGQGWPFVFASPQIAKLSGYEADAMTKESSTGLVALIHAEDRERVLRMIHGGLAQDQSYSVEYRIVSRDGGIRWVLDQGQGVREGNRDVHVWEGVLLDITEQRLLAEQIRSAEIQLYRAQQFSALGNFSVGVAHDFNNLITAINGFADLMLGETEVESPSYGRIRHIHKATMRAATITRQLLALGRNCVQEQSLLDINLLIADAERLIRLIIGVSRRVQCVTEPLVGRVKANPSQVEQVLMVLAMNLTEGRSDDIGVRIETRTWEATCDQAERYGLMFGGAYVVVTLRAMLNADMRDDDPVEQREELLGKEEIGEAGFGLDSVLETLGELQGYLFVSRDADAPSVFEVVIPLVEIDESSLMFANGASAARRDGEETVLIVDDEESVLAFTHEVLARQGYQVLEANSPSRALTLVEQMKGPIDLLVVDQVMPEMSEHELVDQLASRTPGLRVLMMSTMRPKTWKKGERFLSKPFTADMLLKTVEETLQGPLEEVVGKPS
ncbi:MAG: response regulator [Nitrospira sp.]|nr:response regulator [Nitrospira sp.]